MSSFISRRARRRFSPAAVSGAVLLWGAIGVAGCGSGVSHDPKKALGALCTDSSECESTFCVGGACCESACDGVCQQNDENGRCVMPDDDEDCGVIACPESSICRAYPLALTDDRCRAPGLCKTAADCPATFAPARTPCDGTIPNQQLCDGGGECKARTMRCGDTPACPVSPGQCCFDMTLQSMTCRSEEQICDMGGGLSVPIYCGDERGCPTSGSSLYPYVCCLSNANGPDLWMASCTMSCADALEWYVLCDPEATESICDPGQVCAPARGAWVNTGLYTCQ